MRAWGLCVNAVTPMMAYELNPTRTLLVYRVIMGSETKFTSPRKLNSLMVFLKCALRVLRSRLVDWLSWS